jgi:hypothetical protein
MIWRLVLCVTIIGLAVPGCGRKNESVEGDTDLEQFFGKEFRAPRDRSVRIQANMMTTNYEAGGPVEFDVLVNNASKKERTLPLGLETEDGRALTFFRAVVKDPDGEFRRVALAPEDAQGELVTAEVDGYGVASTSIDLAAYYDFTEAGTYRVVLFYRVKDEKLPDGKNPDWTGEVWTSPITINIE